jgi:small subunit ribosomal protein S1
VQLEADLEGLLHISELSDQKIKRPQDVVKVGDELEVKILKVDSDARKIGLSLRRAQWAAEEHGGPSTELGAGEPGQQAEESKAEATESVQSKPDSPVAEQPVVSDGAVADQGEPAGETPGTDI